MNTIDSFRVYLLKSIFKITKTFVLTHLPFMDNCVLYYKYS